MTAEAASMPLSLNAQIRADRALLVERFPNCFCANGERKRPLALGIGPAIAKHQIMPRRRLKLALRDYTTGGKYLSSLVEGASRIGLDGQATSAVTAEHASVAAAELTRRAHKRRRKITETKRSTQP